MKSYRFLGEEAEALGNRLDHARKALAGAKTAWSKNYWAQTVDRLLFQWRQLPILHDGDAMVTIIPRWHVGYDFFEKHTGLDGHDIVDRVYHSVLQGTPNLESSWHNHRAARLARAQ